MRSYFNPRSPHGERRRGGWSAAFAGTHFNPRSPHGERRAALRVLSVIRRISIHAPRTGSDKGRDQIDLIAPAFQSTLPARGATRPLRGCTALLHISIHAPRTGSDMKRRGRSDGANEFQSTLPARGATTSSPASCCRRCHFNPRSPHGERRRKQ